MVPTDRSRSGERDERPPRDESLVGEWLKLTADLLDHSDVTVEELQELVAMQGKVRELVVKTADAASRAVFEEEDGISYRKVL